MAESITLSREFAAPRQTVWDATTTREHFATWFGTEHVDVPLYSLVYSGIPGDTWSGVMNLPDGTTKAWTGKFVESDAPSRFVLTLTDEPENPGDAVPLTMEYSDTQNGTLLTVTQLTPGFSEEDLEGLRAGYDAFFDSMGLVIDSLAK